MSTIIAAKAVNPDTRNSYMIFLSDSLHRMKSNKRKYEEHKSKLFIPHNGNYTIANSGQVLEYSRSISELYQKLFVSGSKILEINSLVKSIIETQNNTKFLVGYFENNTPNLLHYDVNGNMNNTSNVYAIGKGASYTSKSISTLSKFKQNNTLFISESDLTDVLTKAMNDAIENDDSTGGEIFTNLIRPKIKSINQIKSDNLPDDISKGYQDDYIAYLSKTNGFEF